MQASRLSFSMAAAALCLACSAPRAADPAPGVPGKDGWLFYRYEASDASSQPGVTKSEQLISRISRVLARNGVTLVITLVPLKMRIHAAHLPADFRLTPYLDGQYDRIAKAFRDDGVAFIDLDTPFLANPKREGPVSLYYRLDSHWSPLGAFAAAEAIRAAIEAQPELKKIFDVTPEEKYAMEWVEKGTPLANDLVSQVPKGTAIPAPEPYLGLKVTRVKARAAGLMDDEVLPITLLGSSYSADWTTFPDALRFALQRDLLAVSIPASQGSWVGFESYLRDDAFQSHRPKLLIWEMPERDMPAVPSHKYREARYVLDDEEWLLRAAAWIEKDCKPASVEVKSIGGIGAAAPSTKDGDFAEVTLSRPLERTEYLAMKLLTHGSTRVRLEASGPNTTSKPATLVVPGDDEAHLFVTPLYAPADRGSDKVRLYPGFTRKFAIQELRVCRQADDLLQ